MSRQFRQNSLSPRLATGSGWMSEPYSRNLERCCRKLVITSKEIGECESQEFKWEMAEILIHTR